MGKKQKKRQESDLDEVLLGVPPLRGVNKTDPEYNALPPIGDDPVEMRMNCPPMAFTALAYSWPFRGAMM